jgi:tetratricopeptide (TPR) repeat protein
MSPKKLTRKEIVQQDVIRRTLTDTSSWAVENLKYLVGALVVVALAIAIGIGWQYYRGTRNVEMQADFADALAMFHAPVGTEQPPDPNQPQAEPKYRYETATEKYDKALARFQEVASEYSGTRIGTLSQYYAALSENEMGRQEEAGKLLTQLAQEGSYPEVANLARNTLAQLATGDKNYDQAISLYNEILATPSQNFPRSVVMLRVAEALEAKGNLPEALEQYRKITAEFPGSSSASEAAGKIQRIEPRIESGGNEFPEASEAETPKE